MDIKPLTQHRDYFLNPPMDCSSPFDKSFKKTTSKLINGSVLYKTGCPKHTAKLKRLSSQHKAVLLPAAAD